MASSLPSFDNPPVEEVALSVQFDRLADLAMPQIGRLWTRFAAQFPRVEEKPELDPVIEQFNRIPLPRGVARIQVVAGPPAIRSWFLNPEGTELIQVQKDRFVHNWRRVKDGVYPRYEVLRSKFLDEVETFDDFLQTGGVGELAINQCEVTYVNHIIAGDGWHSHSDLAEVVSLFRTDSSGTLPPPEEARVAGRYIIADEDGSPVGRLHIQADPAYRITDGAPMYVLTLTARGRPLGEGIEGAFAFLDLGRAWVVRGFASVTTRNMHTVWRRTR